MTYTYYAFIAVSTTVIFYYVRRAYVFLRDDFRNFMEKEIRKVNKVFPVGKKDEKTGEVELMRCKCGHSDFYSPIKYNDSIIACTRCGRYYQVDEAENKEF